MYVHGIGTHPLSTIKQNLAVHIGRALSRDAKRADASDRWDREAVAGCLSSSGGVISAQRLTCLRDDDSRRAGTPALDVYEVPWSATVRHGRFRWSALRWAAESIRDLGAVIRFRPLRKGLSDSAAAAVLLFAFLATIVLALFAAFMTLLIAIWFGSAPVVQRIGFVATFVPVLAFLAVVKLIMFFLDSPFRVAPARKVVLTRTHGQHPHRRFWRFAYDRTPELNAIGTWIRRGYTGLFWFAILGQTVLAVNSSHAVPRGVASLVGDALLAVVVVVVLVRWFSLLEDIFGDVAVFAAEAPLDGTQMDRRERIAEDIRVVVAAVTAALPDGKPYDRVVLAGHSLGSALLADYLAEDADRAALGDASAIGRLRRVSRVVVYGSPIASFRRFFAARASDERRRREMRFAELAGPGVSTPHGNVSLAVLNVWCCGDVVSNPFPDELDHCVNREIGGFWALAHMHYTRSREFWSCVLPVLLE